MNTIDAEQFKKATGSAPENDDLERSNCPKAGQMGHWGCGWNTAANLPFFMTGRPLSEPSEATVVVTPGGTVLVDPAKAIRFAVEQGATRRSARPPGSMPLKPGQTGDTSAG